VSGLFLVALLFCAPCIAQAAIVAQSATSTTGRSSLALYDTETSLQWLSPTATQRLSIDAVLADAGGWVSSGYRYAMRDELLELFEDAGISVDTAQLVSPFGQSWSSQADVDALKFLIATIGWTYENNQPSPSNPFGQRTVYGILGDLLLGDGQSPASHVLAWFSANDTSGLAYAVSQWRYPVVDPQVGSFLVRTVQSVPEPESIALLLSGLLGVIIALRRPVLS
jgi:hypothetical protein